MVNKIYNNNNTMMNMMNKMNISNPIMMIMNNLESVRK